MRGTLNRHRFSLKYPDGSIERYGCCDPRMDSGKKVIEKEGKFFLVSWHPNEGFAEKEPKLLPEGTLFSNGYYDREHDGWVPLFTMGD